MAKYLLCLLLMSAPVFSATTAFALCDPAAVEGVYGFQLSGSTAISGDFKPAVSLGRLVFDGAGKLRGYSSVNFAGYFLGNPVTGIYDVRDDCSVSWSLRDSSGAFQHFSGTVSNDGKKVQFEQTDPGGVKHGTMIKSADACDARDRQKIYTFNITGSTIPMQAGEVAGTLSLKGLAQVDDNGNVNLIPDRSSDEKAAGTLQVNGDCFAQLDLGLPLPLPGLSAMKFRAILVDDGRQILGIQTDPGTAVTITLLARD